MMVPELTLNKVKETAKEKTFRASDFLTQDQLEEVKKSNLNGKKKTGFDSIDAYIAEIIARFGYDTYVAWKFGEITENNMARFIMAERAREARNRLKIENIIVASVYGANNADKHGHAPKTLKTAIKMLKEEENLAKGVS
jgi:beta-xylosidase